MTYYFGLPTQFWTNKSATTHMFAFEIYADREALYTTHFSSPTMATFLSKIPETMTTGLDLSHYEDVGGFLDRYNDKRECEVMVDVRITCNDSETRAKVLGKLSSLAEDIAHSSMRGTLTFLVLKSLDKDQGVRVFQRFESWKALTEQTGSKAVLDFWLGSKEEVMSMESQCYVPNGKGWLHRGPPKVPSRL